MRALLLNSAYQGLAFISFRKAVKLIAKDKVEIVSTWPDKLRFGNGSMSYPAIVRLTRYVPRHIKKRRYNRTAVFRRDKFTCQYCGQTCTHKELTIDHVLPRDLGGITSWENCVACCFECNNKKSNKTPKMAKMKLSHRPYAPTQTIWHEYSLLKNKHVDWSDYIVGMKSDRY